MVWLFQFWFYIGIYGIVQVIVQYVDGDYGDKDGDVWWYLQSGVVLEIDQVVSGIYYIVL